MITTRILGIRATMIEKAGGDTNPETVCVMGADGKEIVRHEIISQQAEVDFLLGQFPTRHRAVKPDDDVIGMIGRGELRDHHVNWKKSKSAEGVSVQHVKVINEGTKKTPDEVIYVATEIACEFDGIQAGDTVVMSHGFGNMLARDIAEDGVNRNVHVFRIPTGALKDARTVVGTEKEEDDRLLASHYFQNPGAFTLMRPEDYGNARLGATYTARQDAQVQRIRVGNRLMGEARWEYLRAHRQGNPLDSFEKAFSLAKANDPLFRMIETEEAKLEKAFATLLEAMPLWRLIKAGPKGKGIGAVTAAGIISEIGDIRRFMVPIPSDAQTELDKLILERDECLALGEYATGKELLGAALEGLNSYERKCRVAELWRSQGMTDEEAMISMAIQLSEKIGKLQRRYRQKSCNKFLAYAGIMYPTDGVFQRRRKAGPEDEPKRANYSPTLRQRFWVLMTIMNKAPTFFWGAKLREIKAEYKLKHPEVVEYEVVIKGEKKTKKKYTPIHIQRLAQWRCATRIGQWMFNLWYDYEMSIQRGMAAQAALKNATVAA